MRMLLHRDILTQRYFYEEIFLHGFHTRKCFYTHIFLHRDIRDEFTRRNFADTDASTNRGASTKEAFEELLHTDVFTQTYSYMISDGGHQFHAKEFSKQVQNQNFTAGIDDLDALCANGFCGRKQNVILTAFFFSMIETHVLQEDQAKPSERKKT